MLIIFEHGEKLENLLGNGYCVVPEIIHTHPMEGHWKFLGGGGVLKAKFLEVVYNNKPE